MINFQLQLLPSDWKCDIWVSDDRETTAKLLSEKYGESRGYWETEISVLGTVISKCWSIQDNENFIVVYLEDFRPKLIVHEANHILHHFARITGMKWTAESQELQSLYLEWLFDEIVSRQPK